MGIEENVSWIEPGDPSQTQSKLDILSKQVLLYCWWNFRGLLHFELLEPGQTVDAIEYSEKMA